MNFIIYSSLLEPRATTNNLCHLHFKDLCRNFQMIVGFKIIKLAVAYKLPDSTYTFMNYFFVK